MQDVLFHFDVAILYCSNCPSIKDETLTSVVNPDNEDVCHDAVVEFLAVNICPELGAVAERTSIVVVADFSDLAVVLFVESIYVLLVKVWATSVPTMVVLAFVTIYVWFAVIEDNWNWNFFVPSTSSFINKMLSDIASVFALLLEAEL